MIAIPQVIIFLILFFAATAIFPLTTPGMINDFKACGGFLMLATGFRMVKLKKLSDCGHDTGDGADHAYVMALGDLYIAV